MSFDRQLPHGSAANTLKDLDPATGKFVLDVTTKDANGNKVKTSHNRHVAYCAVIPLADAAQPITTSNGDVVTYDEATNALSALLHYQP